MTAITSSAAMHTATSPRDRPWAEQKVSPTDAPQGFFLVCFQHFPPHLHPYPHLKPLTAVRSRPRTAAQRPGMGLLRALLPTVPPLSPSEPHGRSEAEACSSVPYGPTYGSNWCFVPLEASQPPSRPRATPKPPAAPQGPGPPSSHLPPPPPRAVPKRSPLPPPGPTPRSVRARPPPPQTPWPRGACGVRGRPQRGRPRPPGTARADRASSPLTAGPARRAPPLMAPPCGPEDPELGFRCIPSVFRSLRKPSPAALPVSSPRFLSSPRERAATEICVPAAMAAAGGGGDGGAGPGRALQTAMRAASGALEMDSAGRTRVSTTAL